MSNSKSKIIQLGNLIKDKYGYFSNSQKGRVYSINGISPCLDSHGGGQREIKVIIFNYKTN